MKQWTIKDLLCGHNVDIIKKFQFGGNVEITTDASDAFLSLPEAKRMWTKNNAKIKDGLDFMNSIYNNNSVIRKMNRIDRYAKRKIGEENTGFENVTQIVQSLGDSYYDSGKAYVGMDWVKEPGYTTVHELSHARKPFNTFNSWSEGAYSDSPYYNIDYSGIRKRHRRLLTPDVSNISDYAKELSENFSELNELRYKMYENQINDGSRRYTNKDVKNFIDLDMKDGKIDDRYIGLRNLKNISRIRKALNRIYKNGGLIWEPYINQ